MNDTVQHNSCKLCGERLSGDVMMVHDTRFGIGRAYNITRCVECGLYQLSPAPSTDELTSLYAQYYNFAEISGKSYSVLRALFFAVFGAVWALVDSDVSFHRRKGVGRLLDVGCNEGRNLFYYRNNGYDAEGLEVNPVAVTSARAQGFIVHEGTIDDFAPTQKFDVVVLSNVLEHVTAPEAMLCAVRNALAPGGQVWISCPNVESWQASVFGRFWINWHVPFHITHFSSVTLRRLLNSAGFDVVDLHNESPALWAAQSLIASLFSRPGMATNTLRKPFLVGGLMLLIRFVLFPLLWIGNVTGKGDCLVVTATPKNTNK